MPQEYSWEVRERTKELYVVDGLTFDQVAEATGVSVSQLKRWSAEQKEWEARQSEGTDTPSEGKDWPEARKEFRLALGSIRRDSVLLRGKLIANALVSGGEFKKVLAAGIWEKTQAHKDLQVGSPAKPAPEISASAPEVSGDMPVIKTAQDAIAALEGVVVKRINLMATRPELLSFNAIKDLQKTLGLIGELQAKYRPETGAGQTAAMSDETIRLIQEKLLGTG